MSTSLGNHTFSISGNFEPLKQFGHITQQIIMPIIALADEEIIPLGTGFVINPDGLLMTAKHVIEDFAVARPKKKDGSGYYSNHSLYALYISDTKHGNQNQFFNGGLWPLDKAWFSSELDIAFCWLKPATINGKPFKPPAATRLTFTPPSIGEHILGFGYYASKGTIQNKTVDGKRIADYSHKTAFTQGVVKTVFAQRRDSVMLRFPCFEIDARFDAGMSGGPVYNEKGYVCGVICSSIPLNESDEHLSYASLLWPALGTSIEIKLGQEEPLESHTFYELAKRKHVITDQSINAIQCVIEPNGTRKIYFNNSQT